MTAPQYLAAAPGAENCPPEIAWSPHRCITCPREFPGAYNKCRGVGEATPAAERYPIYFLWIKLPGKAAERVAAYFAEQFDLAATHRDNYNRCYKGGPGPNGEVSWIDRSRQGRFW